MHPNTESSDEEALSRKSYDEDYLESVLHYETASYFFNIPMVIYMTLPRSAIEETPKAIEMNIASWKRLNPSVEVIVYDDEALESLTLGLLPELEDVWPSLLPVQKTDIFRYAVVYTYGGWYADSDVIPVRPIRSWGHGVYDTLVVGVEAERVDLPADSFSGPLDVVLAQYVFGAAPKHPMLFRALEQIISTRHQLVEARHTNDPERRLRVVLDTTGPIFWTQQIQEHFCYQEAIAQSPDQWMHDKGLDFASRFHHGGSLLSSFIHPPACIGGGQEHTHAIAIEDDGVCAVHTFGGSQLLNSDGVRWTSYVDAVDA